MKTPNVTVTALHINTSDPDAAATELMKAITPILYHAAAGFEGLDCVRFLTYVLGGTCGFVSGLIGREATVAAMRAVADDVDELQRDESTRRPN